jgi:hypothetical protein
MPLFLGLTILKSSLILTSDHFIELNQINIAVKEQSMKYILYYKPQLVPTDPRIIQHLKNTLKRVKSDKIYNSYNDDFGLHHINDQVSCKLKPLIVKK